MSLRGRDCHSISSPQLLNSGCVCKLIGAKKGALFSLIYFFGSFCVYYIPHNYVIPQPMPHAIPQTHSSSYPYRTLPTMHCRSQHCWELLHLFSPLPTRTQQLPTYPPTSRSATRIPFSFLCLTTLCLCKISFPITLFRNGSKWLFLQWKWCTIMIQHDSKSS